MECRTTPASRNQSIINVQEWVEGYDGLTSQGSENPAAPNLKLQQHTDCKGIKLKKYDIMQTAVKAKCGRFLDTSFQHVLYTHRCRRRTVPPNYAVTLHLWCALSRAALDSRPCLTP